MHAEVIAIGDELTSGQRLDTNSQWLSQRLGELGVPVLYHTAVGDDLDAGIDVFRRAIERADVIVATGGLGPTADDLTRECLAAATGTELQLNEGALEHIQKLFARRARPMPERNRVQAMFPAGSRVIDNPHGTAPGIAMTCPRQGDTEAQPSLVFCLPGVPAEMKEMWPAIAAELANQGLGPRVIRHRVIKCFGVGESDLEQMLPDLIRRGRQPTVGITVHAATITLRVTAAAATVDECMAAMGPTLEIIQSTLGDIVFGDEDEELEHAVLRLLSERKQTLATAEWGTDGLLASWLGSLDQQAEHFHGGLVFRSAAALEGCLGLSLTGKTAEDLRTADITAEIAAASRTRLGTDFALAVSPSPSDSDIKAAASGDAPIPQIHFALSTPTGVQQHSTGYAGHPDILKSRAAKQALNLLRLHLLRDSK